MDFLSIRKKARERAEARERQGAPGLPAPSGAGPASEARPIEQALRDELGGLTASRGSAALPAPPPGPAVAGPPEPTPERDALEEFFWREDEEAPPVPDLGGAAPEPERGPAPGGALQEYVTFLLGGEEYGLAIGRVREIVKPPPIAEVPRAPPHVLGVVTLRGEVVPVFDPRGKLSLPARATGRGSRIVVCESARGPAGLLVDAVSHVVRLPPSAVEPRPAGLGGGGSEAIVGIGREGSRLVILLDLDLLLDVAGRAAEAR